MLARHPGSTKRRRRRRPLAANSGSPRTRFYLVAGLGTAAVTLLLVPQLTHLVESLLSDLLQGSEGFFAVMFLGLCAFFFMMSRKD